MQISMTLAYNLDRLEREQFHPVPPRLRPAIDDERWQVEPSPQFTQRLDLGAFA